jgi:uncharacterized membrane protein HdeD (DUF308 family)
MRLPRDKLPKNNEASLRAGSEASILAPSTQDKRREVLNTLTASTRSVGWSMFVGVLLLLAGLLAIVVPFFAGIAAGVLFGWLVLLAGVAHLVYAWSEHRAGAILWQILIGIVYVIAALYMLVVPVAGVAALTLVLAFYIAVEGVFELVLFSLLRLLPGAVWFLIDGLVSLLLAGLIFFHWPSSSLWAVGTLVGISLMFSGIARLTLPMSAGSLRARAV